jgi:hypothetical protein
VLAVCGHFSLANLMVAVVTHVFCVMSFVCVWTFENSIFLWRGCCSRMVVEDLATTVLLLELLFNHA